MTISADQKRNPKGSPKTTKNHQYGQHNVIQKAKKLPSKTRVS